jgi:hypothetical protein
VFILPVAHKDVLIGMPPIEYPWVSIWFQLNTGQHRDTVNPSERLQNISIMSSVRGGGRRILRPGAFWIKNHRPCHEKVKPIQQRRFFGESPK